jgi:Nrap protein domain 6
MLFRNGRLVAKPFTGGQYQNVKIGAMSALVDFSPVDRLLEHLRATYDEEAYFFHNQLDASVIGVVWKPAAIRQAKRSAVNVRTVAVKSGASLSAVPSATSKAVGENLLLLLHEMERCSRGLVARTELQTRSFVSSLQSFSKKKTKKKA